MAECKALTGSAVKGLKRYRADCQPIHVSRVLVGTRRRFAQSSAWPHSFTHSFIRFGFGPCTARNVYRRNRNVTARKSHRTSRASYVLYVWRLSQASLAQPRHRPVVTPVEEDQVHRNVNISHRSHTTCSMQGVVESLDKWPSQLSILATTDGFWQLWPLVAQT